MKTIDRIKSFIDEKGISLTAFDLAIEAGNGYIGKQIKRGGSIGSDILEKIVCAYPDINIEWLLTGEGCMDKFQVTAISNSKLDRSKVMQGIPYYNIQATAGIVQLFNRTGNHIPMDHINIPNLPKCDGAIPIVGDSMYPLLKSGDIVLYRLINDKSTIMWGEMYIILILHQGDEYFFVKYVQKSNRDGYAKFVSQNSHHQPVEFPIDSIEALAVVKASIRINNSI